MSNEPSSPTPSIIIDNFSKLVRDHFGRSTKVPKTPRQSLSSSSSVVQSDSEKSSEKRVVVSPQDSILAKLAYSPQELALELRKQLLQSRSSHNLSHWKHFYRAVSSTITATESSISLFFPADGSAINQRASNSVRLHKLRLKFTIDRSISGTGLIATYPAPMVVKVVLWRERIPVTPGTPPTLHGTDNNPPTSSTLMFSQLGVTSNRSVDMQLRNPNTLEDYHIYHIWEFDYRDFGVPECMPVYTGAAVNYAAMPAVIERDFEIPLHKLQNLFASNAATYSEINNMYLTFYLDTSTTANTCSYFYTVASDIEFEDDLTAL